MRLFKSGIKGPCLWESVSHSLSSPLMKMGNFLNLRRDTKFLSVQGAVENLMSGISPSLLRKFPI